MNHQKAKLMDESRARPTGPIDWNRFKKQAKEGTLGEGTTNSNYLEETREQDPWPEEESDAADMVVQLETVRFKTPVEELVTFQPFEMLCDLVVKANTSKRRIAFVLMSRYTDPSGHEVEECQNPEGFEGFLPATQPVGESIQVEATGKLYAPDVQPGTVVQYWLKASNSAASKEVESSVVEVTHQWPVHVAEVPDVLFHHNGSLPCLDEDDWLIHVVVTSIRYAQEEAPVCHDDKTGTKLAEELVAFGHTDSSGEYSLNYDLSDRRAQAIVSLINRDVDTWKQIAKKHGKVEDYQQDLQILNQWHGWDCDPGQVDNQDGPKTQAGVKAFQKQANQDYSLGLAEDGLIGPMTWGAIHRVLCGLIAKGLDVEDPTSAQYPVWELPKFGYPSGQGCFGCGESFLRTEDTESQDQEKHQQLNRRVELIFMPIGKLSLEAPSDRHRQLSPEECPPYDEKQVIRHNLQGAPIANIQWDFSL